VSADTGFLHTDTAGCLVVIVASLWLGSVSWENLKRPHQKSAPTAGSYKTNMAAFVAKQMVGNKLNAVKGAVGGDDDSDDKEKEEEAERERQEAIREAEERRKEKHRKMEEEREKMRQEIRDKYNIKKKEEVQDQAPQEEPNPLMRKKKTPEELAREAEAEEEDEFTKLKNSIESQVSELKSTIESKCVLQWDVSEGSIFKDIG